MKSVGQYFLPFSYDSQCGFPEVAKIAFSYSFWNSSASSGSMFKDMFPLVPTRAMSVLLKNLNFAAKPCTRLGRCHVMVFLYFQCFSNSFHIIRRFFGFSKTIMEKSGFWTLAIFAIHFSVKSGGRISVSRYLRSRFRPNPSVALPFLFLP